jgi:hypothetical protein
MLQIEQHISISKNDFLYATWTSEGILCMGCHYRVFEQICGFRLNLEFSQLWFQYEGLLIDMGFVPVLAII